MILGLTGGFAAGKSSVASFLEKRGFARFDADAEVHRLLSNPGPAREAVSAAFPDQCPAGNPDRAALARAVFGDPAALVRLEAILHPLVRASLVSAIQGARDMGANLVCEVPLLVENSLHGLFDAVWTVEANEATRAERARRLPAAAFAAREARLAGEAARAAAADAVIHNNSTLQDLEAEVGRLLAN